MVSITRTTAFARNVLIPLITGMEVLACYAMLLAPDAMVQHLPNAWGAVTYISNPNSHNALPALPLALSVLGFSLEIVQNAQLRSRQLHTHINLALTYSVANVQQINMQ